MIDHVHIVSPPTYPHSQAFNEIAEAFAALYSCDVIRQPPVSGRSLVFGAHIFPHPDGFGRSDIIYQSEQIIGSGGWLSPNYFGLLSSREVWDYSEFNVTALAKRGIKAKFVPIGYHKSMTKIEPIKTDIDVLFYGSTNPWRSAVLRTLENKGLNVVQLFNQYGVGRDYMIARAKVCINLHAFQNGIFEIFRCAHLFANSKCVIAEIGRDKNLDSRYKDCAVFVPSNRIVETVLDYVYDDEKRKTQELRAFESFKKLPLEIPK